MNTPNDSDDVKKTGHVFDGIEEYDNPIPRWWLYMTYATVIWGIGYMVVMPAWGPGLWGWTQDQMYADEMAAADKKYAAASGPEALIAKLKDPAAIEQGKALFAQNCAACHGVNAEGLIGPNLADSTWLYGGKPQDYAKIISDGTEKGMPSWKKQLGPQKMAQVVAFIDSLQGAAPAVQTAASAVPVASHRVAVPVGDAEATAAGKQLFAQNCASCHGPDGKGLVGPDLTDKTWLYGGKADDIAKSVGNGTAKGMPAWAAVLGPDQVAQVSAYVHSLGGGQ